ncbi:MAG: lysophospholipase [Bacteroidales bacterium]|nr:lysophospholipase [Bacteroidales bacterium]
MQRGEYYISRAEESKVFFRYWGSTESKTCICILHGWGSNGEVYEPLAQFFMAKGFSVTTVDLRGHGRSEGKANLIRRIKTLSYEADLLLSESEKLFPQAKKVLMGHQIGALIALQYYLLHRKLVSALMLSAPFFKPAVELPKRWWAIRRLIAYIFPFYSIDVSESLGITQLITSSGEGKTMSKMNARLLCEVKEKGQKMITQGYKINVPTLVLHSLDDPISLPKSSVVFVRNTGYYTTFKNWQGKGHYLTERNDPEVFEFMKDWLINNVLLTSIKA